MQEELLNKLSAFYEQTPAEKQASLKLVLEVANENPDAFVQLIKQQKFDSVADRLANNLPIFYEALAADLPNWAGFFIQEVKRLFALARLTTAPQKVLASLDEFCFIDAASFKHREALVAILKQELTNERMVFRYYAAWTLADFIRPTDFAALTTLRQLLHDPNWRIRYQVYQNLRDLNLLTEQDTLSWLDRGRALIWNPYISA